MLRKGGFYDYIWNISQYDCILACAGTDLLPALLDLRFGEYETRGAEEVPFESHRTFWDLQIVMDGEELVGYSPLGALRETAEYDPVSDITFYSGSGQMFRLEKGMMMLLSPFDGHQPGVSSGKTPSRIRKIVVKLPW